LNHLRARELSDEFHNALTELATEIGKEDVEELLELAEKEQVNWLENSTGWKVIEAFKDFIKDGYEEQSKSEETKPKA